MGTCSVECGYRSDGYPAVALIRFVERINKPPSTGKLNGKAASEEPGSGRNAVSVSQNGASANPCHFI